MVTGRISLTAPEYSPISSSVSEVRRTSSSFHCRAATVLVTRISVVAFACAIAAAPTSVLPAPHGSTTTPGAAVPERLGRLLLVGPQRPVGLVELDRVRLAVDVPGVVLGRPADLEQRLLEVAALATGGPRPCRRRSGRRACPAIFLARSTSSSTGRSLRTQHQPVHRVLLQPQPAVARHRLGDVDQQRVRDGVAAELQQRVDHLLGVVAGGPRVPQAQRRQPVGVDVLRRPLELGERRDRLAAVGGALVVDLEQQGLVALHDQRAGSGIHQS